MTTQLSASKIQIDRLKELVAASTTILVLQPDSPDGDSMWTALGLEEILSDLDKQVVMYSYREAEPYLRVYEGWDRVGQDFPKAFDFTIVVDTGSPALIKSTLEHHQAKLLSKPVVVIDHHTSRHPFGFDTIDVVFEAVATAEQVTAIAMDAGWAINEQAAYKLTAAILSDSLNLTTSGTTAHTVQMVAELTKLGANLGEINRIRRQASALTAEQVHLKGKLLSSIEYLADGRLAVAEIPPLTVSDNLEKFEPYNMIISEMQWTKGVELVAVFKNYGTKINVPMRSVYGVAGPMAEIMGGGGHPNAGAYRCDSTDFEAEKNKLATAFVTYKQETPDAIS
jgi:nanoRNase/pAp phosphatase (c-di-AMP/oligoRNAs hydrolase)